jgi:amino acid adenylation domain-containing protein
VPTLDRLPQDAALKNPSAPAIRCETETLTYEQLARRSGGLARVLRTTGLGRGDRCAVWLGRSPRVPVSFYGAFAAGGALVPIDPKSPLDLVVSILRATGATHLVTDDQRGDAVRDAVHASPEIRHVIGVAADKATVPCTSWSEVLDAATEPAPPAGVTGNDLAYILHTSGSTGQPKLIAHTHSTAMSFVEWAASEFALTADDRLTNHSSHHTCFATFDFYAAARAGAATIMLSPSVLRMPASLSGILERERATVWYSVPAALIQLSLRGDLEARELGSLRRVLFAGENFPLRYLRRLQQQLPKARFTHLYGSTEVNVCTFYHVPPGELEDSVLPIGRPCATAEVVIADQNLQPVPDGEVGELLIGGSTVMTGYWSDPERNRSALVARDGHGVGRYFRSGDRVRRLPDGNLAYVARADRQVKIRGHRVELDEVEGVFLSLDSVEEAAAFVQQDGEGSSSLHVALVIAPGESAHRRDWATEAGRLLPPYALPSTVQVVSSLPRTPTGKVDLRALSAGVANKVAP